MANDAAPSGHGGGGSAQRGGQPHTQLWSQGGDKGKGKSWRGQNQAAWGNAPMGQFGGGFGKGGNFTPAQMVQVFGEAMRQMGSASAGGKGFVPPKGAGGPKTWVCRSCKCADNWADRELCRICGVSWRFKGLPTPGGDGSGQGGSTALAAHQAGNQGWATPRVKARVIRERRERAPLRREEARVVFITPPRRVSRGRRGVEARSTRANGNTARRELRHRWTVRGKSSGRAGLGHVTRVLRTWTGIC